MNLFSEIKYFQVYIFPLTSNLGKTLRFPVSNIVITNHMLLITYDVAGMNLDGLQV